MTHGGSKIDQKSVTNYLNGPLVVRRLLVVMFILSRALKHFTLSKCFDFDERGSESPVVASVWLLLMRLLRK